MATLTRKVAMHPRAGPRGLRHTRKTPPASMREAHAGLATPWDKTRQKRTVVRRTPQRGSPGHKRRSLKLDPYFYGRRPSRIEKSWLQSPQASIRGSLRPGHYMDGRQVFSSPSIEPSIRSSKQSRRPRSRSMDLFAMIGRHCSAAGLLVTSLPTTGCLGCRAMSEV